MSDEKDIAKESAMDVETALAFADQWIDGVTVYKGMEGWRIVCAVLATEVRLLRGEKPMTLAVKRLTDTARLPTKGSDGAAGFDLYADEDCCLDVICDGARKAISTGIAVSIDPDKVGLIWPRSGMAAKYGIDTGAGVIDSDYRGEIKVLLFNLGNSAFEIKRGDRIAQLLIVPVYGQSVVEVDDLSDTARGVFGFGSTGR